MHPARRSALALVATFGAVALAPAGQVAAAEPPVAGDPCADRSGTTTPAPTTTTRASTGTIAPSIDGTGSATAARSVCEPEATTTVPDPATTTTVPDPATTTTVPDPATTTTVPGAPPPATTTTVPGDLPPATTTVPGEPPPATTTTVPGGQSPVTVPTTTVPEAPTSTVPAINAPAVNPPSASGESATAAVPERQPATPIEEPAIVEPTTPTSAASATAPGIAEPSAPLPPTNLTWTRGGVARPAGPRVPGTTSLQLGRTPAGERVVLVDDVEVILATIRQLESAGHYEIGPNLAQASGAYQFIPSTWNNYGGYPEAYLAPPAVQDERARADVLRFLATFEGDVSMVPVMWYYPRAVVDPTWMDRVPNPAGGNRLTIREYQTKWLQRLAENATAMLGTYVAAPTTPAAVTVLSEMPSHEPTPVGADGAPVTDPAAALQASPLPPPTVPAPSLPAPAIAPTAEDQAAVPPVEIPVDSVTVSDETMDLAARSAPPETEVEDGLGSMRSIVFPVLGPVSYANGWGDPRSGGRLHEGTDIIGVRMQPILAAVDGVISRYQPTSTGIRGVAISVADADGWRYNYFHNNDDTPGTDDGQAPEEFRLAPGLELGDSVLAGQIIGYMGDSGNAEESVAHLHFELRDPTGRARPSFWSLRAAEARQACTIGIGPWSTPTVDEPTSPDQASADADASVSASDPWPAPDADAVMPPASPVTATPPVPGATPATDAVTDDGAVVDPSVEHTVVTPMFGDGQWVIDSEGRVTATGDAALIIPRTDLQCDVGPATPFGTDSAGWGDVESGALDGTVLAGADLTGTVLQDVVPEPLEPMIPTLVDLAQRVTGEVSAAEALAPSDAGPVADQPTAALPGVASDPKEPTILVEGGDVTIDGAPVVDPISQPMLFTDPATGETIIVVFELPVAARSGSRTLTPPL